MVNVITVTGLGAVGTEVAIDISTYLEDKIAVLVGVGLRDMSSAPVPPPVDQTVDAYRRMAPLPAGETITAGHVRLTDWQEITFGDVLTTDNELVLTVLYLKDAPGKYP